MRGSAVETIDETLGARCMKRFGTSTFQGVTNGIPHTTCTPWKVQVHSDMTSIVQHVMSLRTEDAGKCRTCAAPGGAQSTSEGRGSKVFAVSIDWKPFGRCVDSPVLLNTPLQKPEPQVWRRMFSSVPTRVS